MPTHPLAHWVWAGAALVALVLTVLGAKWLLVSWLAPAGGCTAAGLACAHPLVALLGFVVAKLAFVGCAWMAWRR